MGFEAGFELIELKIEFIGVDYLQEREGSAPRKYLGIINLICFVIYVWQFNF